MPKQEISQADIAETFCKTLFNNGWVSKGHLYDENEWGIDVLYHKRESGKLMFHFITQDKLEINLEFDLVELNQQGKIYIDSRIELLITQADAARAERQRENKLFIGYGKSVPELLSEAPMQKPNPVAKAISTAIETGGTVH